MNKHIVNTVKGIAGGFCISIGAMVYLSLENKIIGAFLFSIGLLSILTFQFNLYTGKIGQIINNVDNPSYLIEVLLTWIGNFLGTALLGITIHNTGFIDKTVGNTTIRDTVAVMINNKANSNPSDAFFFAILCGILMFIAVEGYKYYIGKDKDFLAFAVMCLPVMTFILSGFNHSIADMAYIFINGVITSEILGYLLTVSIGNFIGGLLISIIYYKNK